MTREKMPYVEPDVDALLALPVPHIGVPRRDLTRDQFLERREAYAALSDEQKGLYDSSINALYARRRKAAAPAKPTNARYLSDEVEPIWIERARALDLFRPGITRRTQRVIARRLADAATEAEIEQARAGLALPTLDDDALLLTYLEREAARWRSRAARDQRAAVEHRIAAEYAETRLVAHMRKLGILS